MSLKSCILLPAIALAALAGDPAAAAIADTDRLIAGFYNQNALEWHGSCRSPRIQRITRRQFISDDGITQVIDIRYRFRDRVNEHGLCNTFGSRRVTIENGEIVAMTGLLRSRR